MVESKPRSIVGVMADVARINIGTYRCEQCTVWGIDEEEHEAFTKHGVEIHPRSGVTLIMILKKSAVRICQWSKITDCYNWPNGIMTGNEL